MHGFGRVSRAFVRAIDPSLAASALRLNPLALECAVDLVKAKLQHENLVAALRKHCGVRMIQSLPSDGFPDSVFIEDTAVALGSHVLVTQPGADSRRGETEAVRSVLARNEINFSDMSTLDPEARMDGGDVLFTGKEFIVGLSDRTNIKGAHVLSAVFANVPTTTIDIKGVSNTCLHLKSACSMAGENHLLVGGALGEVIENVLSSSANYSTCSYKVTRMKDSEAANVVYANGVCLRRCDHEFPESAEVLRSIPGTVVEIEASELAKVDGALTCCSLLLL